MVGVFGDVQGVVQGDKRGIVRVGREKTAGSSGPWVQPNGGTGGRAAAGDLLGADARSSRRLVLNLRSVRGGPLCRRKAGGPRRIRLYFGTLIRAEVFSPLEA